MATAITISTGALSRNRTFANDTKAQAAMLKFYEVWKLGPASATAGQKLDALIDWFVDQVERTTVENYLEENKDSFRDQARQTYGFE